MRRAWLVLAGLLLGGGAAAAPLDTAYLLTWRGLAVAEVEASVTEPPQGYAIAYRARATGLLGWLFPFTTEGRSEGRRDGPRW